jgi:Zn-dependent protease
MLSRTAVRIRQFLTWHTSIGRGDRAAEALRRILYPLTTVPGIAFASCLALLGFALTISALAEDYGPIQQGVLVHPLLLLILFFTSIVIHEAAHAVATKTVGRSVNGIGIGWHWIVPVAFVDTTDSWLATPSQRVAVTLAGPLANGALAGVASVAAISLPSAAGDGEVLSVFALLNVYLMLFNLAPVLSLDGYLALTDVLARPQLRQDAIAEVKMALRSSWVPRMSPVHSLYLAGSFLYLAGLAWLTYALGRILLVP